MTRSRSVLRGPSGEPAAARGDSGKLELIPEIHRLTHRIALVLERSPALGVTQGEAHILAHLAGCGEAGTGVAQLHRALAHKRSTLTSILDRLERKGLVRRKINAADRRSILVRLTPRGRMRAHAVRKRLEALESRLLQAAPRAHAKHLTQILRSLAKEASAL